MKFKDFLQEVKETSSGEGDFGYDTVEGRHYEFEQFKENGKKVGNVKGQPVFMKKESGGMAFAVLDDDNDTIDFISRLSVDEEIDNIQGYSQSGVWKNKDANFKATDIILDIILKKVKLLVSDRYLTGDGKKMWINIFKTKGNDHKCGVFINKTKECVYFKNNNLDEILDLAYYDKNNIFFIFD